MFIAVKQASGLHGGALQCQRAPTPPSWRLPLQPFTSFMLLLPIHVVFHTFCLCMSSLSLRASALAALLAVKLHAQAERRRPTLLPPRLHESRPAVSLCLPWSLCLCCFAPAADGHQAVPVDTWLHQQWAPVCSILNRHVCAARRGNKKAAVFVFYRR